MFQYYFTYWDDLPSGIGFEIFGKTHMIWLAGITFVIIVSCICFLKCSADRQKKILRRLALVMLMMEAYKDSVLFFTGHMSVQYLPLQLCGMAIFAEALFAFFPCTFFGEFICAACLPGAAAALLFPDWSRYPVINYMNLHGFVLHAILVLFPILVMISGKYTPKLRNIYMPLLFFAVVSPIIYRINIWQGTNFMFLNRPSTGSPFETIYANSGYACYLLVYGATVLAVILIMYGLIHFILIQHKKRTHGLYEPF